jgi:hypothetical protein
MFSGVSVKVLQSQLFTIGSLRFVVSLFKKVSSEELAGES